MSELALSSSVTNLISGMAEAYVLRGILVLLGALVLGTASLSCYRRRVSRLCCLGGCITGLLLLLMGAFPEQIITHFITIEYVVRMRTIAAAISLGVLLITLESIRRTHLHERYAILWVLTAGVILVVSLFPHAIDLFRVLMGMSYVAAVIAFAFVFLLLVAFHFSITLSAMQDKQSQMAQRIALLQEELATQRKQQETQSTQDPV